MKASQLIAALEDGKLLATGDPEHIEVVRLERSNAGNSRMYIYGWGSACGTMGERLESILYRPWLWVICEDGENTREIDANAARAMLDAGRCVDEPESRFGNEIWRWNDALATE